MQDFINYISNSANKEMIASITAMISVLIASISVLVAVISTIQNRRQYKDSIQPQLSMRLLEYNHNLYLQIKNTGKLAAKAVTVKLISIENNGYSNKFSTGGLFESSFELYPEEAVQDMIATFGASIIDNAFPKVSLEISYCVGNKSKCNKFERTVTFVDAYTEKISADINIDTQKIESSIDGIERAAVRTANYLDGHQLAPFDKLNVLTNRSLANDLQDALGQKPSPIKAREEIMYEVLSQSKVENTNDDV